MRRSSCHHACSCRDEVVINHAGLFGGCASGVHLMLQGALACVGHVVVHLADMGGHKIMQVCGVGAPKVGTAHVVGHAGMWR